MPVLRAWSVLQISLLVLNRQNKACYGYLIDLFVNSNKTALNQTSKRKVKYFFLKF